MKRIVTIWVAFMLVCSMSAQQARHTVQRGETFASIASKYGISEQELRSANPYNKNLYVGIQVFIPYTPQNAPAAAAGVNTANVRVAQAYMENAWKHYHDMKYAKAIKETDKALEEYPLPEAYLLRGKCNLMRNKYRKACEDFAVVMESREATAAQREEAAGLNRSSVSMWEERRAEKAQFWGSLAQDVVAMAQDMTQQKMLENQMVAQAGHAPNDKEFNKNLQDIYRKAGKQMRQEQLEGYMSFKTMMWSTTGQDVSYEEYRRLQVEQFTAEQEASRASVTEETEEAEEDTEVSDDTNESTSKTTTVTQSKTASKSTVTNRTQPKKKEEKLDAKQQWKKGKVSSNSFREIKDKFVNLYSRHGDNARQEYSHKKIYEKGGSYYVEIGSTYYKIEYSNWGAFNKMIIKGSGGNLYFNVHL